MYVKIVRPNQGDSLYECTRFFIEPCSEGPERFTHSIVTLESTNPLNNVYIGALDRTQVEIYVMNDQGKTIERYAPIGQVANSEQSEVRRLN